MNLNPAQHHRVGGWGTDDKGPFLRIRPSGDIEKEFVDQFTGVGVIVWNGPVIEIRPKKPEPQAEPIGDGPSEVSTKKATKKATQKVERSE